MIRKNLRQPLLFRVWVGLLVFGAALLVPKAAAATTCVPFPPYVTDSDRLGINVVTDYGKSAADYDEAQLWLGWYLDFRSAAAAGAGTARDQAGDSTGQLMATGRAYVTFAGRDSVSVAAAQGVAHAAVFRLADLKGDWQDMVGDAVAGNPAGLWIVGNEPDRDLQDGGTPAEYAVTYHDVYTFIKAQDPAAKVAIAGVVQPTPLRMRYLDMVLEEYRERYGTNLPVDMFNVHGFILREDDTWGAGIPLGLEAYASLGRLYEVPDHGNLEIFKQQIVDFRRWMEEHGYRNTPLMVSEYGILMPPDYDAGGGRVFDYEYVGEFMTGTFDFFLSARDAQTGYPADDNRLVQAWAWYSLNDYLYSWPDWIKGFNGNLLDHDSGLITPLGKEFAAYASRLYKPYTDATLRDMEVGPAVAGPKGGEQIPVQATMVNRGNQPAAGVKVQLWRGDPQDGGSLIGVEALASAVAPRCSDLAYVTLVWEPGKLPAGFYRLTLRVVPGDAKLEAGLDNNSLSQVVRVGPADEFEWVYLPTVGR